MGKQKYFTEEERLAAIRESKKRWQEENAEKERERKRRWREEHPEYDKQYRQENPDKVKDCQKRYYQENKEKVLERQKQYRQENAEKYKEYFKLYRQENAEKVKECSKRYRQENAEKVKERKKEYRNTPMGRAGYLVSSYQQNDKKYNRGECTLTAQWIVDNIFTSKCRWCKKTDWHKLGCDRIDNSLPHTPDNVIPCCEECNTKRGTKTYEEFLMTISPEGQAVGPSNGLTI